MAICRSCGQEMVGGRGCLTSKLFSPDGKEFSRITFGQEINIHEPYDPGRCNDCSVAMGEYHHPGCDLETCPKCGGQLISCGCFDGIPYCGPTRLVKTMTKEMLSKKISQKFIRQLQKDLEGG